MLLKYDRKPLLLVCLVIAGLIGLVWFLLTQNRPTNVNSVANRPQLFLDETNFETLDWNDLASIMRLTGRQGPAITHILEKTTDVENLPTKYLRGLLFMANSQPSSALVAFESVAIDEIPPLRLYAPFRLHDDLEQEVVNPYFMRLRTLVDANEVPALISARVRIREGRLAEGLQAYLATDPANWTNYDARCLKQMLCHAGLESEVRRLLIAAVGSGRIPNQKSALFSALALGPVNRSEEDLVKKHAHEAISTNSVAANIAIESAKEMLETRRLFLEKQYKTLLSQRSESDPVSLTTESVLMLFLSALQVEDRPFATRWGQEIMRRQPRPEAIRWVETITQSTFQE